jgi:NADH-quinone oxidoreductase subunit C
MLNQIADFLNQSVSGSQARAHQPEVGTGHVFIESASILAVMQKLFSGPYGMHVLQVISGVDYTDRIEVNYMLANFKNNTEVMIKTSLPKTSPEATVEIDSVASVWKAANFQERECFDMLGVVFKGHPDLRRILCPEDWKGFPLRKDYVVEEVYNGMVVNPEHKVNSGDHYFYKDMLKKYEAKQLSFSWKGASEESSAEASE